MMVDVKGLAVAPEVRTNEFVVADALLLLGYLFARVDAVAGGGGERASFLSEAVRGPAPSVCFSDLVITIFNLLGKGCPIEL